jgi:copper(I)-binding protein
VKAQRSNADSLSEAQATTMLGSGRPAAAARFLPRLISRRPAAQPQPPDGPAGTPAPFPRTRTHSPGGRPVAQERPLARWAAARAQAAGRRGRTGPRGLPRRAAGTVAILAATATLALSLSGCGSAKSPISVDSAYIPQPTTPGSTVAYLDIRNNGASTDHLVSASTSVGGQVGFLAPSGMRDGTMVMHLVQDISIPGNGGILRMNPNSFRLRITGAGPMRGGKDVILKLKFTHAGTISVIALVTDPESGGGGYFLS